MEEKMTHLLARYIKRFFSYYLPVTKGLANNTILAYRDAVKLLICYAADNLNKKVEDLYIEHINESLVLDYLDYLEESRGCSPGTRNARLAAIPFPVWLYRQRRALPDTSLPDYTHYPYQTHTA